MLNIVVPIISNTELKNNHNYPLALHEILNKSLIEYSLSCIINTDENIKYIFLISEFDCLKFHLDDSIKILFPSAKIVVLKSVTKGTVCSVLMAIDEIEENSELLIFNYNQYFSFDIFNVISSFRNLGVDSGIITFDSIHPRWAYAILENNYVIQTAEKRPLSGNAISGLYYFKNSSKYLENSYEVIRIDDSFEGGYYISSVINQYVLNGGKIYSQQIDSKQYFTFYSTQSINEFENFLITNK
jgi:dTDP-glucose pyrophosphorylase